MADNRHTNSDLRQMQALPLHAKIRMTQERIRAWYNSWSRVDIYNEKTGKRRFVVVDTRDGYDDPPLKPNEYIESVQSGWVYLSFSGGKDSTVLYDIISKTPGVYAVPSVFVDTGLEYPEVRMFATERADVIVRPEMRFDEVIKTYGYPVISKHVANAVEGAKRKPDGSRAKRLAGEYGGRKDGKPSKFDCQQWSFLLRAPFDVSDKCCNVMKKKPAKKYQRETGRVPILATMTDESALRKNKWLKHGCNAFDAENPTSQPMSFWTEQDVLQYIRENDLPIASVYGEVAPTGQLTFDLFGEEKEMLTTTGCDRTGCMFCMFGCHLEEAPNRFQRMKETHPRQYEYCMRPVDQKGLGLKDVLQYLGIPHE